MKNKLCIVFCILLLSSCATMFTGTTKRINMMTSNNDEVKVDVTSIDGTQTVTIPSLVSVSKGNIPITITVKEDECHKKSTYVSENHLNMIFLGNAFNYFVGTTTDVPNGAMWTYDDNVVVPVYRKENCAKK